MMAILTDLGDLRLLIPITLIAMAWLWWNREAQTALRLAGTVLACILTVFALKLTLCSGWMPPIEWRDLGDLRSPSGHASMSAVVYGTVAVMIARAAPRPIGLAVIAGTSLLIAMVAYSRIRLNVHTRIDVLAGLAIGLAFVRVFALAIDREAAALRPEISVSAILLLLGAALAIAALRLDLVLIQSLCWA